MKFLKITLCALLLLALFLLPVAAEAPEADATTPTVSESAPEEATVTEAVLAFFSAHTGDILCVLTFLSSLFTVRAYKSGLLPTLTRNLGKLGRTVESGIGSVREQNEQSEQRLNAFLEECKPIFTKLAELESESFNPVLNEGVYPGYPLRVGSTGASVMAARGTPAMASG